MLKLGTVSSHSTWINAVRGCNRGLMELLSIVYTTSSHSVSSRQTMFVLSLRVAAVAYVVASRPESRVANASGCDLRGLLHLTYAAGICGRASSWVVSCR